MINVHFFFRTMVRYLLGLLFFSFSIAVSAETASEQDITTPTETLHTTLIQIMESANGENFEQRYHVMEPVINDNFNTALIARVVLSRYWKKLDAQKQAEFIDLFNRLTISTYVSRFDSFNGESFKALSVTEMKKNRFLVRTQLIEGDGGNVAFDYIVQRDGELGPWKIISVIADGVNDLSLKRAEYSAVIKNKGYAALIADLEEKIINSR